MHNPPLLIFEFIGSRHWSASRSREVAIAAIPASTRFPMRRNINGRAWTLTAVHHGGLDHSGGLESQLGHDRKTGEEPQGNTALPRKGMKPFDGEILISCRVRTGKEYEMNRWHCSGAWKGWDELAHRRGKTGSIRGGEAWQYIHRTLSSVR